MVKKLSSRHMPTRRASLAKQHISVILALSATNLSLFSRDGGGTLSFCVGSRVQRPRKVGWRFLAEPMCNVLAISPE